MTYFVFWRTYLYQKLNCAKITIVHLAILQASMGKMHVNKNHGYHCKTVTQSWRCCAAHLVKYPSAVTK